MSRKPEAGPITDPPQHYFNGAPAAVTAGGGSYPQTQMGPHHRERSTTDPGPGGLASQQPLRDTDSSASQRMHQPPPPLMPTTTMSPFPLVLERRDSTFSDLSTAYHHPFQASPAAQFPYIPTEKFPSVEISDFSTFMYGPATLRISPPPPPSTVSRTSSVGSILLSPVHTEQQSDNGGGFPASWSRGPSPLRNSLQSQQQPEGGAEYAHVCHCGARFPGERGLETHRASAHAHACLWGSEGPCERSGGFATREELNWHVKLEHLLVCPVLGCVEGGFGGNRELLDCHVRHAHKSGGDGDGTPGGNLEIVNGSGGGGSLLRSEQIHPSTSPEQTKKENPGSNPAAVKRQSVEDKRLKMDMSIGISKKRCREQLKNVVEKRYKKTHAASTPRTTGESPGTTTRSLTPTTTPSFPLIWEHSVLPFLAEFMPKWCGPGHVISITRGKGRHRDRRLICFMTRHPVSTARKVMIAGHVRDLLSDNIQKAAVAFAFSVGEVGRLHNNRNTWARGLGRGMPDEVCVPRNPFCYISPCMGDSIGTTLDDGDDVSATLGPCLVVGGGSYWLANLHPFLEVSQAAGAQHVIEHPSPADRDSCLQENHDALESPGVDFRLGTLTATSGFDLKTTRLSHEPYWEDMDKEPPLVVTDWTLISSQTRQANLLRRFPSTATTLRRERPVTEMSSIVPGVEVSSTGRTSGFQRGQVCEIPAYVDGSKSGNGTGKATREWYVEELGDDDDDDNAWIQGGIGVQGDSGAAVVDSETNALLGQVWGRNKYFGSGPRVTFFTPMLDVIDDIQERCGEQMRPQLPQYRDEAERWAVYPVCRPCFDLRAYMDTNSRRSSRESLMSMIPGAGAGRPTAGGDNEHDLTDVSELATPRGCDLGTPRASNADLAYWVRHVGPEDGAASSSFHSSVVSPGPVSAFYGSMVPEMRSPYALELHDEDIYGHDTAALGKRPEPTALVRSVSQQSGGKRRRIM